MFNNWLVRFLKILQSALISWCELLLPHHWLGVTYGWGHRGLVRRLVAGEGAKEQKCGIKRL